MFLNSLNFLVSNIKRLACFSSITFSILIVYKNCFLPNNRLFSSQIDEALYVDAEVAKIDVAKSSEPDFEEVEDNNSAVVAEVRK